MLEKFERYYREIAQQRAPLGVTSRITLSGVPGTGKTWQLLSIAKFHAENGKNVLFLCYNHVLKTNIEQMVGSFRKGTDYGSITVHTIFDHIGLLNETGNLGCVLRDDEFDAFADDVIQQMFMHDFLWETYDTVLLDEAQDLKQYVGPLLQAITLQSTNIIVGVGTGQNLYLETAPAWLDAFMNESEVCELDQVYRTTAQIFQAAQIVCEAFTSNEKIETVAKRVLSGRCHGLREEVRPLRSIGRPPAIRRYKVEASSDNKNAEMHIAGMKTQVDAILSELDEDEKFSDILFLIPSNKSPTYHALLKALDILDVPRIDFTIKENRNTTPKDHQVRISTFHSSRGVEARIVVLLDLDRLAERTRARQQLYIGLTRAIRLAIVLEPDIAVSQLATLLERAAACINAASTHQDFKKNIPQRPVKRLPSPQLPQPANAAQTQETDKESDGDIIHIPDDDAENGTLTGEPDSETNDTDASSEMTGKRALNVTPQQSPGQEDIQQATNQRRPEPSGFGTSIFDVMNSKTVDIKKRIDALYNWDSYADFSEP